jgi:hypothetical protein
MYTAGKNIPHEPLLHTREPEAAEGSQGTKRKTNQLETGDNLKPASVPIKRAKTIEEASHAARSTSPSVTPRPKPAASNQKPAAPSKKPVATSVSKKRSNFTDDAPEEPRTPAPPLKKARVQQNTILTDDATPEDPRTPAPPLKKPRVQKKKDTAQGKAQALRRTGKSHLI